MAITNIYKDKDTQYYYVTEDGVQHRRSITYENTIASLIESSGQYKVLEFYYQVSDGHLICKYTDGTSYFTLELNPDDVTEHEADADAHHDETHTPHAASDVEVEKLGAATYDDVQNYMNFFGDRTLLTGGAISSNGDGSATVASGTAWTKATDSETAIGLFFNFPADASVSLTDMAVNFIYVDYNVENPQIVVATDATTHGFKLDHVIVGALFRDGTTLHIKQTVNIGIGRINKVHMHHIEESIAHRASGVLTSGTGTRQLVVTSGVLYAGLSRQTTSAFNTSVADTFSYWYTPDSGSSWTKVAGQTAIDNTQYNDITSGLSALTGASKRGVHWVYLDLDGNDLHVVYGQDNYSTADAELAAIPAALPPLVANYCLLIAKIIIQKDQDDLFISYPWAAAFLTSLVTDHRALGNVTADQHHSEDHAARHQNAGDDEIDVTGLSGVLADDQHAESHVPFLAASDWGVIDDFTNWSDGGGSNASAHLFRRIVVNSAAIGAGDCITYVDWIPSPQDFSKDFTWAITFKILANVGVGSFTWIKMDTNATSADPVDLSIGFRFDDRAAKGFVYGANLLQVTNLNTTLNLNQVYSLKMVFTAGDKVEWYIDGVLKGTEDTDADLPVGFLANQKLVVSTANAGSGYTGCYSDIPRWAYSQEC